MRFGEILATHRVDGWTYIDYDYLKSALEEGVVGRAFFEKLIYEIAAVDAFFKAELASGSSSNNDLLRAAVLNYLAVCKISKKHAPS